MARIRLVLKQSKVVTVFLALSLTPLAVQPVRGHLKQMVALSRASWQAIEGETDNDRVWIPTADQTRPFATLRVTDEHTAAWRAAPGEADRVLDGALLGPHSRFTRGINLQRVFEEPQPFDFVLWATDPAALPFLVNGPIASPDDWSAMISAFGGSFGLFSKWVN